MGSNSAILDQAWLQSLQFSTLNLVLFKINLKNLPFDS